MRRTLQQLGWPIPIELERHHGSAGHGTPPIEILRCEVAPWCVMVCFVPRGRKQIGCIEHLDAIRVHRANSIDMPLIEPRSDQDWVWFHLDGMLKRR
jgi:hypothetical protein